MNQLSAFLLAARGEVKSLAYMRPKSIVSAPSFGVARGPSVGMKSWKVGAVCNPSCSVKVFRGNSSQRGVTRRPHDGLCVGGYLDLPAERSLAPFQSRGTRRCAPRRHSSSWPSSTAWRSGRTRVAGSCRAGSGVSHEGEKGRWTVDALARPAFDCVAQSGQHHRDGVLARRSGQLVVAGCVE